jgi:hypothetical protein
VRLADGRLQVGPTSYDVDAKRPFEPVAALQGGPPPEDTVDFWTRAGRNADLTCYGCHATAEVLTAERHDARGFPIPGARWIETGVGCEACHGPGGRTWTPPAPGPALPRAPSASPEPPRRLRPCRRVRRCHALQETLRSAFADVPRMGTARPRGNGPTPLLARPTARSSARPGCSHDLRARPPSSRSAALAPERLRPGRAG